MSMEAGGVKYLHKSETPVTINHEILSLSENV